MSVCVGYCIFKVYCIFRIIKKVVGAEQTDKLFKNEFCIVRRITRAKLKFAGSRSDKCIFLNFETNKIT